MENNGLEPRKPEVFTSLVTSEQMQQMIALEPTIRTILEIAADPEPRENRWIAYGALKRMMRPLVGFDARHDELRSSRYYDVMIDAIDRLLPNNDEQVSA